MKLRIRFVLNTTHIDAMVILLTDLPSPVLNFLIETPAGDLMDPAQATALGHTFAVGANMSYYRFTLPLPVGGALAQTGTWYAVLDVDDKLFERYAHAGDQSLGTWSARMAHGVRYSVNVQALSNLKMEAQLTQSSLDLGATMTLRALLVGCVLGQRGQRDHARVEQGLQAFHVCAIGLGDNGRQRHPRPVGQQRAFGATCAPIGGVGPRPFGFPGPPFLPSGALIKQPSALCPWRLRPTKSSYSSKSGV